MDYYEIIVMGLYGIGDVMRYEFQGDQLEAEEEARSIYFCKSQLSAPDMIVQVKDLQTGAIVYIVTKVEV